jgi:hypothetical protein
MRGILFQKPLELVLNVEGEKWLQGDPLSGTLTVKNHGAEPASLASLEIKLAHGTLRKVHQKLPDAYDFLATFPLEGAGTLEPKSEASFPWRFKTDANCPITDVSASLFLLYGQGHLQLPFDPSPVMQEFVKTLEVGFRFVKKSQRYSAKGRVDVKLSPPDSKAFGVIDLLVLSFKMKDEETLDVQYIFQLKKVAATAASVEVNKERREISQSFTRAQYRLASGRFNHEVWESGIREALKAFT